MDAGASADGRVDFELQRWENCAARPVDAGIVSTPARLRAFDPTVMTIPSPAEDLDRDRGGEWSDLGLPARYRVIRLLGEGGQGRVFEVRDLQRPGEALALKWVGAKETNGAAIEALRSEFAVLARLRHPAIARVRDFGRLEGGRGFYLSSELVHGQTLSDWFIAHPPEASWRQAIDLLAQALGALHAIHRAGVHHGDLKPSHLLVAAAGDHHDAPPAAPATRGAAARWRLRIIDFGAARWRVEDDGAPSGSTWSTPLYRAPADWALDAVQSDLHALGLSFFHALAGRLPFDAGELRSGGAALEARGSRLSEWLENVPRRLDGSISRLLSRWPEDRFPDALAAQRFLRHPMAFDAESGWASFSNRPWVGHEEDLEQVLALLRSPAGSGSGPGASTVLLGSPPGMGKTRLIEALIHRLQLEGWSTVSIRGDDPRRGLGELISLARSNAARRRALDPWSRPGLALPEASPFERPHAAGAAEAEAPAEAALTLLECLRDDRWLIAVDAWPLAAPAGESKVVESVEALLRAHLARPAERLGPRFVVATREPDAFRGAFPAAVEALAERRLEAIDPPALRRLLAELFQTEKVPEPIVELLSRSSGGCPARIWQGIERLSRSGIRRDAEGRWHWSGDWRQALEALSEPRAGRRSFDASGPGDEDIDALPRRILDAFEALDGLAVTPPEAKDLLSAVDGALDGLTLDAWERSLDALYWRGALEVARSAKGSPRFRRSGTPAPAAGVPERRGVAERVFARYRSDPGGELFSGPDAAAALVRLALALDDAPLLRRLALEAAGRLRRCGRHSEALSLLQELLRAVSERGSRLDAPARWRAALHLRIAQLCRWLGRSAEGLEALRSSDFEGSGRLQRWAALWRAAFLEELARFDDAIATIAALLDDAGASEPLTAYFLKARIAELELAAGRGELAKQALEGAGGLIEHGRSVAAAPAGDPSAELAAGAAREAPLLAQALTRFGRLLSACGLLEDAIAHFDEACRLAAAFRLEALSEAPLEGLGVCHGRLGSFERADAALAACAQLQERRDDRLGSLRTAVNRATLAFRAGRRTAAEDLFRRAAVLSDALGPNRCSGPILIGLAALARLRGDLLGSLRLLKRLLRAPAGIPPATRANALFNLGEVYLSLGYPFKALEVRDQALEWRQKLEDRQAIGFARAGRAMVLNAIGRLDEARRELAAAQSCALGPGDPLLILASALEARIDLDACEGVPVSSRAVAAIDRALELAAVHRERLYYELASFLRWEALLLDGRREDARRDAERRRAELEARFGGDQADVCPFPFLRAAFLGILAEDAPPIDAVALPILRDAREAGHVWEALQLALLAWRLRLAVPRDRWPPMRQELEAISGRFLGAAAADEAGGSRPAAAALERDAAPCERSAPPASSADNRDRRILDLCDRWARLSRQPAVDDGALERELEAMRCALGASGLWVLSHPRSKRPPAIAAAGCSESPIDALLHRRKALEKVRRGGEDQWGSDWCLLRLHGPGGDAQPRVLAVTWTSTLAGTEQPAGGGLDASRPALIAAAGILSLVLDNVDLRRALAAESERARRHADEARELHARMLREKSQIETAAISQRVELAKLRRGLGQPSDGDGDLEKFLVLKSAAMREVVEQARKLAKVDIPVLLVGEHGVGKDFVARLIHAMGPRSRRPFLSALCEVPESLLESELFGVTRGAFTGADVDRPGVLASGHGGTLYLDRIEEMSPAMQARLVRAIEEKRVRPLGGEESQSVDVRLISSTCLSVAELESHPALRRDFLFRLQGVVLRIPPLRERSADLVDLFEHFIASAAREAGVVPPEIAPDAKSAILEEPWPGNLRQLQNVARRIVLERPEKVVASHIQQRQHVAASSGDGASEEDGARPAGPPWPLTSTALGQGSLPSAAARAPDERNGGSAGASAMPAASGELPSLQEAKLQIEAQYLTAVLERCLGNATKAARILGISRRHLGTLLARHGLDPFQIRRRLQKERAQRSPPA
jgi:DNA-binding NtrC family response regulator/serine/threonine protein kinase